MRTLFRRLPPSPYFVFHRDFGGAALRDGGNRPYDTSFDDNIALGGRNATAFSADATALDAHLRGAGRIEHFLGLFGDGINNSLAFTFGQ